MSDGPYSGDVVDKIMQWESGEMGADDTIDFFGELVRNGAAWKLQGCYGRMAARLIDGGYLSADGTVLKHTGEED